MHKGPLPSESELLLQIQQGDENALAALMRLYYKDLFSYASRFTRDNTIIKDCIQEVFISLWQRRETAPRILAPRYYLLRATKNRVLKTLYKNNHLSLEDMTATHDSYYEFSIEQVIIDRQRNEERAIRLKALISQLTKKQKEIIYLKYYQFLDHRQIAELMNLNQQSVYNLLHEAIRKLRELLKADFFNQ